MKKMTQGGLAKSKVKYLLGGKSTPSVPGLRRENCLVAPFTRQAEVRCIWDPGQSCDSIHLYGSLSGGIQATWPSKARGFCASLVSSPLRSSLKIWTVLALDKYN